MGASRRRRRRLARAVGPHRRGRRVGNGSEAGQAGALRDVACGVDRARPTRGRLCRGGAVRRQLRLRIRAYEREKAWAPAYVGESLTATSLAADARRRTATLLAARAESDADPAAAARLRQEATEESALADALRTRVAELSLADDARAQWL